MAMRSILSPARTILRRNAHLQTAHSVNVLMSSNFSSASSSPTTPLANLTTSPEAAAAANKGIFSRLWERYSIKGQQMRIERAERLFRSAQRRSMDRTWHTTGRIGTEFRPKQAILTMHVWLLHKRLTADKSMTRDTSLLIQEELFDILWNDTRSRIRAEGIHELMVNKHLKDIQQLSLQHCMHFDHAFSFEDAGKRREELANVVWTHILLRNEDVLNDHIQRLVLYVEWEYNNIVQELPEAYFREGRIAWGDMIDFTEIVDNEGNAVPEIEDDYENDPERLPPGWVPTLADSGDTYYWNMETMETSWDKPKV